MYAGNNNVIAADKPQLQICIVDDEVEHLRSFENLLREVLPSAAQQNGESFDPSTIVIRSFDNAPDVVKLMEASAVNPDAFPYDVLIADVFMPREPGSGREHPHGGAVRLYDAVKAAGLQDRVVMLIVSKDVVGAEDELVRIDGEQRDLDMPWAFKLAKPDFLSSSSAEAGVGRDSWIAAVAELIARRKNQEWRKKNFLRLPAGEIVGNNYFDGARTKVDALTMSGHCPFLLVTGERGTGKEAIANYVAQRLRYPHPARIFNLREGAERGLAVLLFGQELPEPREGILERTPDAAIFIDNFGLRSSKRAPLDKKLIELFESETRKGRRDGAGEFYRVEGLEAKTFRGTIILSCERIEDLNENIDVPQALVNMLCARHVRLPPLRDAKPSIGSLARHFIKAAGRNQQLDGEAFKLLTSYDWPGNLKELEEAIAKVSAAAENGWVTAQDLRRIGLRSTYEESTLSKREDSPRYSSLRRVFSLPQRGIYGVLRKMRRAARGNVLVEKVGVDLTAKVISNLLLALVAAIGVGVLAWLGFGERFQPPSAPLQAPASGGASQSTPSSAAAKP